MGPYCSPDNHNLFTEQNDFGNILYHCETFVAIQYEAISLCTFCILLIRGPSVPKSYTRAKTFDIRS